MSYPLPIFDSKRRENRPKLFNSSLQQFVWNELSDKEVTTNLASVFVLYKTPPKLQNEDPLGFIL